MSAELSEIKAEGARYCEALWSSDVATLRGMFHARSNLYGVGPDGLEEYTSDAWLEIVGNRAAGEGSAQYELHAVENPAPGMGVVTLDCAVVGREFTDTLNFLKFPEGWRVIAKTFHVKG